MPGTLYLVATPIGNLGDISPRALETLRRADFIAAEDTRVSLRLLRHFGIENTLVSYHEHNKHGRGGRIIERLLAGESCAVVTDAGMPCISDPGEELVQLAAENGIETVIIPGPSAVVSALALSGLPTGRFAFEGFLSVNKGARARHLEEIKNDTRTLIFYEAPHKLLSTLEDMLAALGDRRVALARELTKLHEEVIRTTLSEALARYREQAPRGEYVLVIEGAAPPEEERFTPEEATLLAKRLMQEGMPITQAAKEAAKRTGFRKNEIYKALL